LEFIDLSSGIVHRKASLILASGFLLGSVFTFRLDMFLCVFGALLGIMMTPDWDVDAGFLGDKIIRNKIGWLAEKIWDGFLYWYRRSLKHGSPLSHLPIISTFGRIFYIFLFVVIMPHVFAKIVFSAGWDLQYVLYWYWDRIIEQKEIIIGLMGSDLIHWALDVATTEHKEKKIKTK
jgi:uncharacterized metal-binding protein